MVRIAPHDRLKIHTRRGEAELLIIYDTSPMYGPRRGTNRPLYLLGLPFTLGGKGPATGPTIVAHTCSGHMVYGMEVYNPHGLVAMGDPVLIVDVARHLQMMRRTQRTTIYTLPCLCDKIQSYTKSCIIDVRKRSTGEKRVCKCLLEA